MKPSVQLATTSPAAPPRTARRHDSVRASLSAESGQLQGRTSSIACTLPYHTAMTGRASP